LTYARATAIDSSIYLALLIIAITTFWIIGQHVLAIRGQILNIPIHSTTQLSKLIGSPGVLSGNIIKVPIHSVTHVFRFPIAIQEKGTQDLVQVPIHQDLVQVPIHIPINECGNTVNATGVGNTCNNSK
jgi:ChpA-C